MLAPALDHLGRPAQIYVHVAVIQRARAKMIGDMAGQWMLASRARTGGVIGELRDTRSKRLDPFDLHKIGVIARPVNESHGLFVSTRAARCSSIDKIGPTPVPPARNRIGRRGARR